MSCSGQAFSTNGSPRKTKKKKSKSVISQVNLKSCQNKIASAELMPWNPFTRSISWGMHSADASEVTDTLLTDFK